MVSSWSNRDFQSAGTVGNAATMAASTFAVSAADATR